MTEEMRDPERERRQRELRRMIRPPTVRREDDGEQRIELPDWADLTNWTTTTRHTDDDTSTDTPEPEDLNPNIHPWFDPDEMPEPVVPTLKKENIMETVARRTGIKKKPEKKIGIAWPAFLYSFRRFWPNIEVITDYENASAYDLIVFSGGEDIDPQFYGENNTMSCGINRRRDEMEHMIFRYSYGRSRSKTKILGVCRGHQLITALTGGSLWQDFRSSINPNTGERFPGHGSPHELDFRGSGLDKSNSVVYKFFEGVRVSSMHHQAVRNFGSSMFPVAFHGGLLEASENDRIITTQFHPEFDYAPGNAADKFFKFIAEEW